MKKAVQNFSGNENVKFIAVQTVFEGRQFNTRDRLVQTQKKFNLNIPMGHNEKPYSKDHAIPGTMLKYRSGGTPWTVIIGPDGKVVYNDFNIGPDNATGIINGLLPPGHNQ